MSEDLIRYDVLVAQALRDVVRKVLGEIAKTGLPGDHHMFVSFDTRHPGVRISPALRAQHEDEMTIVLQHQFWDLVVTEQGFSVGLSFSGKPENLAIPFSALTGFADPSVDFGLRFEPFEIEPEDEEFDGETAEATPFRPVRRVDENFIAESEAASADDDTAPDDDPEGGDTPEGEGEASETGSAEVVSLDAFRKKT